MERRLAAILAADMVGYSRLMAANEAGTIERQKAHRAELIDPKIGHYGGRIVKTTGDGLLVEFPSVVDAVQCAVDIQRQMPARESQVADDERIRYRIGLNLGDIVIDGDDILGDGVNIAARLESLAEPDGICISQSVHAETKSKLDLAFEDLGEKPVKNIPEPIRVFRILLNGSAEDVAPATSDSGATRSRHWQVALGGLLAIVLVAAVIVWQEPWVEREEPARQAEMAFPLPDKPSIAVLPFNNMSEDTSQEYFADGMTEDLITDLSKVSSLFVIARNSSFFYKGKAVKVRQVSEELGVRYVLEGSVRRAGDQVRINAQLIDATTGGHVWAERYDGKLENIFDLQDRVTAKIVAALAIELSDEEQSLQVFHQTENAAAHDAYLQGWAHYKVSTLEALKNALPLLEEAIRLDPNYAQAHAALATLYWDVYVNDWAFDFEMPSFRAEERSNEHLEAALKSPTPLAHILQSRILASYQFLDDALAEAEKAVALDQNSATALAGLADALVKTNRPREGLSKIEQAIRLDPHHPPTYLILLGTAQFGSEQFEAAATTFQRAISRIPKNEIPLILLAASYGHLGLIEQADEAIEAANDLRHQLGARDLSLLPTSRYSGDDFDAEIDFAQFGSKPMQELVRAGLTGIPSLQWQFKVVVHRVLGPGNTWYEVEGATQIDLPTAKELYDRGVKFVDASLERFWKTAHIPGAINLPGFRFADKTRPNFSKAALRDVANPEDEIVIYFDNGNIASAAWEAAKAVTWGYQKVYLFDGGAKAWEEAGYPIETAP